MDEEPAAGPSAPGDSRPGLYRRSSRSLEFDRVIFFSDAVFAIAMTLLVVGIGIPHVRDAALDQALRDKREEIISFFISFAVIGFYWLAHHRFVSHLRAVDVRFMRINLLYLAAIAFTPFPTALVGVYADHPISVVIYAVTLGAASFFETGLFWHAYHAALLDVEMSPAVFRYNLLASSAPVVVFAASIPIAYLSTEWALLSWLLIFPLEVLVDRTLKPSDTPDF
jgi:TMEM175 potassium channel family protein